MRAQTVILLAIVALLLASSLAWAQFDGPPGYVVTGTASGGHYRLTSVTWQAHGIASGGGYRLAGLVRPTGTGTPCCCSHLPITLRKY